MEDMTKILILLTLSLVAACGTGDDNAGWTPVEPPAENEPDEPSPVDEHEGDEVPVGMETPMVTPYEQFEPVVDRAPGVALRCATAAFESSSIAYVVDFRDDGTALLKRGPAHAYRESLNSPEEPVRGPIDEHETNFEGTISDEHVDVALPLFRLEVELTHRGYFRGRAYVADHGEEDIECWTPNFAPPFRYDGESGECTNERGDVGWNRTGVVALRETGFGECADLRGLNLNERDYGYPVLQGLNLAGANLEGAQFHFALLEDADLRGTQMMTLEFGYAWLSGTIDAHSRVLEECIVNETEWICNA